MGEGHLTVTRRGLVLGAVSVAAAVASRRAWAQAAAGQAWDLIVIGAGSAGIPAALFAAERGARVLVLEKAAEVGGTLHVSAGQVAAGGTRFQAANGIQDSPEQHLEDILRLSRNTVDPALARLFVREAPGTLDWLDGLGWKPLPGHPILGDYHDPFTVRRYLWADGGGKAILALLRPRFERAVAEGRIDLMLGARARDLLQDRSGAVLGVAAERDAGGPVEVRGRRVLLATGGCAANPAMYQNLHGVPLYINIARPTSQGDGLTLGVQAGGTLRGAEKYLCTFGAVPSGTAIPSGYGAGVQVNPSRRPPWEVFVNARGERFVNEEEPSVDVREHALMRQPDHRYWIVFDGRILRDAPPLVIGWTPDKVEAAFNAHPMFARADTVEGLAARAGIDAAGLARTVARFNAGQAAGADPLGRRHAPLPIAEPPYHAVRVQGWTLISFAGLTVDDQLRVLRPDGAPVPNLYAAGEVLGAGATSGHAYVGGMMLTPALTFGRHLGRTLAMA